MSTLIRDGSHSFRKTKKGLAKLIAVGKKAQMRVVPALGGFRVVDLLNPVTTSKMEHSVWCARIDILGIAFNEGESV
jgi:hypothetical protein